MTTLIRLDGEIVAAVGATRAYLAPQIEALPSVHPQRAFVLAMCEYALGLADGYSDQDAIQHARRQMGDPADD